ncbi:hypothetical protein DL767_002346 [Monosporascus sp. MG133]|nr:hypothetical protein DL767_002346 [Monosporascus sp. MG133]
MKKPLPDAAPRIARLSAGSVVSDSGADRKQSQQKPAAVEQLENQKDITQVNPLLSGLETPVSPSDGIPNEYFGSPSTASNPGSSCALSLFGNYALLDFLNMDNFTQPATTDPSLTTAMPTLHNADEISIASAPQRSESIHRPSYSGSNSKDMTQATTPEPNSSSTTSYSSRASSSKNQDTPMRNSLTSTTICTDTSLEMAHGPQEADTRSNPEQLVNVPEKAGWQSPLHLAAQKGHDRIVRVLLQHESDCNERDGDGLTPLFHAIIGGHEDVVTSLVEHEGTQIDGADGQGHTALHLAVLHRREALLKVLLKHCEGNQALINSYDSAGRTPLHTAVDTGFEAGVRVLLEHGANLHYRTRKA